MKEEFHGNGGDGIPTTQWKVLYGWGTINTNIWLPSLCELVGYTGTQHATWGTYNSAMQGLNVSVNYWTDAQGGTQFAWFTQYNQNGGGQAIMKVCNQQATWTRSPVFFYANRANSFYSANGVGHDLLSASCAVHPAVLYKTLALNRGKC